VIKKVIAMNGCQELCETTHTINCARVHLPALRMRETE